MSKERRFDPHMPAVKVASKWGNNARFARAIGKTPSTTDRWLANGYFPGDEIPGILEAAKRDDILIHPHDLVDMRLFEVEGAAKRRGKGK